MHEEPLPNMCSRWVDGSGCVWGPAFITERLWQPFAIDPLRFNVRIPIILLKVQKEAERRWMRLSDSREKIIHIIRSSLAFKWRHLQTFFLFIAEWILCESRRRNFLLAPVRMWPSYSSLTCVFALPAATIQFSLISISAFQPSLFRSCSLTLLNSLRSTACFI